MEVYTRISIAVAKLASFLSLLLMVVLTGCALRRIDTPEDQLLRSRIALWRCERNWDAKTCPAVVEQHERLKLQWCATDDVCRQYPPYGITCACSRGGICECALR